MRYFVRQCHLPRRRFLVQSGAACLAGLSALGLRATLPRAAAAPPDGAEVPRPAEPAAAPAGPALVAITLDLEMSRHYPTWEQTHWDYEKGNLDEPTKRYALEAGQRVLGHGGRLHYFAVGQVFEQPRIDWLAELAAAGHPIGNHTYDHVNLLATTPEAIQFRFQRAPWLISGRAPADVLRENVRLCSEALRTRLGQEPAGFRTPGGFHRGLYDRPDVQALLAEQGFPWVSSLYPAHPNVEPGQVPGETVLAGIVAAQAQAQPFRYASGLLEVPMSPISDVGAFRSGRWKLEAFLEATRRSLAWVIEHGAVFDFLAHPSCLVVEDPEFRTIELICQMVAQAGDRAKLVDLSALAQRAAQHGEPQWLTRGTA